MSGNLRQTPQQSASAGRWMVLGICFALAALAWLVFWQTTGFEFVNYDDADNVSGNAQVAAGLSWHGVEWAFTHPQVGRWAPLTTISHMADCEFFGSRAGGHHLTNVALHAVAAVLLFLALQEMTGALWRSAFVAAVFAIHPLRAEAVAWVSARGDLLAGVFFMLTLLAYARYARESGSRARYWGVVAFFALGLMCKPTIVMLPFVLLLFDYRPLGRFTMSNGEAAWFRIPARLIVEKIPLFALAAASCAAAALAQGTALVPGEKISLAARLANAPVSCVTYAWQTAWPSRLAVFYPFPAHGPPAWQAIACLLLLAGASAAAFAGRRHFPFALTGWCWYLVMLLPVIGIFETGAQAHADRYTYLPQTGLCLLAAWGTACISAKWEGRHEILGVAAGLVIVLLVLRARDQVSTWQDSVTLWNNAVESTGPDSFAENNLGNALMQKGRMDEALQHLQKALAIDPALPDAHISMGNALLRTGHTQDAIAEYRRALQLQPDSRGHIDLGVALLTAEHNGEAIAEFQAALAINPDLATAHNDLGEAFRRSGRLDDAITQFRKALELDPGYQSARDNLSLALRQKEQADSGAAQ
jgi:protein O-mannosyl-transferase